MGKESLIGGMLSHDIKEENESSSNSVIEDALDLEDEGDGSNAINN